MRKCQRSQSKYFHYFQVVFIFYVAVVLLLIGTNLKFGEKIINPCFQEKKLFDEIVHFVEKANLKCNPFWTKIVTVRDGKPKQHVVEYSETSGALSRIVGAKNNYNIQQAILETGIDGDYGVSEV